MNGMVNCDICNMKFVDDTRLQRHKKTHANKKPKKLKKGMPDFDKPDFTQVM